MILGMHLHDVLHVVCGDLPGRELPPGVGGEGGLQLVQDDAPQPAQGSVLLLVYTVGTTQSGQIITHAPHKTS